MNITVLYKYFRGQYKNMFLLNCITDGQKVGVLAFLFMSADDEIDSVMMLE